MTEHIPAITKYRTTNGWREGWDRHAEEWCIIAPPPPDCSPAVSAAYRAALVREKARWEERPPVKAQPSENIAAAYARGYAVGRKKGRAEAAGSRQEGA